jgi:hypothetical protein
MTRLVSCLVALVAVTSAGCGDDASTPTSPSTTASVLSTRLFTGTLVPGETQFFSFTITQDSGVALTLASLVRVGDRVPGDDRVDVALGVPRGTGCQVATRVLTEAALTPQIHEWRQRGVHCVSVSDPGTLEGRVTFALRIGYYQ